MSLSVNLLLGGAFNTEVNNPDREDKHRQTGSNPKWHSFQHNFRRTKTLDELRNSNRDAAQ
jgi:hypothetical protein